MPKVLSLHVIPESGDEGSHLQSVLRSVLLVLALAGLSPACLSLLHVPFLSLHCHFGEGKE